MSDICVVFTCNKPYFEHFIKTCTQLVTNGKYTGNICLVIGDDLKDDKLLEHKLIKSNNIEVKHFNNIVFPIEFLEEIKKVNTDGRNITKTFQWHKLYLFDVFFKKWGFVFYIDCGMTIFSDITPIIKECKQNTLLAHSDAYPTYVWKLNTQFDKNLAKFARLNATYNLNIDYFQTSILLFDTSIIEHDTFSNLYNLALEYPITRTNEQGIMALYFTNIKPCYQQIKIHNEHTHYYDYLSRNRANKYIMLKMI